MNNNLSGRLLMLAVPFALVLAGCNRGEPAKAPADTTAAATTATPADKPAKPAARPAREYPDDYALDTALAKKDVAARMALVGKPVYLPDEDKIEFVVNVTNTGRTAIVGKGKLPVNVAVTLAGPDGVDEAPGVRTFQRKALPLIPEGSAGKVKLRVPADKIEGLTVRLELVQEGVAWWGKWKQPTLDVGTFKRCSDPANGMCTGDGAPLAKR